MFQNLTSYPYPSTRRVMMGKRGAVATSQPLAASAGMEMLWAGGNAVDAAVAMAIALTVVEPTYNGIGETLLHSFGMAIYTVSTPLAKALKHLHQSCL